MTKEELEEFEKIVADAATGGLVVTLLEIFLCITLKSSLNSVWILTTAL